MNKAKRLMKVYNYLELTQRNNLKEIRLFSEKFGFSIGEHKLIDLYQVGDFYSQPFKPEMITELFEGWESYFSGTNFQDNGKHEINILPELLFYGIKKYLASDSFDHSYPETLNDFIRDCQRAGIELTWKEQR